MNAPRVGQRVGLQLPNNEVIGGKVTDQTKSRTYVESDDGLQFRFSSKGAALGKRKARMVAAPTQNGHIEEVEEVERLIETMDEVLSEEAATHAYLNYLFPASGDFDLTVIKTVVRELGVTLPQIQAAVQAKYTVHETIPASEE